MTSNRALPTPNVAGGIRGSRPLPQIKESSSSLHVTPGTPPPGPPPGYHHGAPSTPPPYGSHGTTSSPSGPPPSGPPPGFGVPSGPPPSGPPPGHGIPSGPPPSGPPPGHGIHNGPPPSGPPPGFGVPNGPPPSGPPPGHGIPSGPPPSGPPPGHGIHNGLPPSGPPPGHGIPNGPPPSGPPPGLGLPPNGPPSGPPPNSHHPPNGPPGGPPNLGLPPTGPPGGPPPGFALPPNGPPGGPPPGFGLPPNGPPGGPPPGFGLPPNGPPGGPPPQLVSHSSNAGLPVNLPQGEPPSGMEMPTISAPPPVLIVSGSSEVPASAPAPQRTWPPDWSPQESTSYLKLHIIRAKWNALNPAETNPRVTIYRNLNNKPKAVAKTRPLIGTTTAEFNELFYIDFSDSPSEFLLLRFINSESNAKVLPESKIKSKHIAATFTKVSTLRKKINMKGGQLETASQTTKNMIGELHIGLRKGRRDFDTPNCKMKWYNIGHEGEALISLEYFETKISGPTNVQANNLDSILSGLWANPEYKEILENAGFKSKQLSKNPQLARRVTTLLLVQEPPPPPPPPAPGPPPPPTQSNTTNPLMGGTAPGGLSLAEQLAAKKGALKEPDPIVKGKEDDWKDDVQDKLVKLRAAFDTDSEESWSDQ